MAPWLKSFKTILGIHMAQMLVLLRKAKEVWLEHDYYHPYDFALNFNALRRSTGMKRFFSVYPQARLSWQILSDRSSDAVEPESNDDDGNGTFNLPLVQSYAIRLTTNPYRQEC